MIESLPRLLIVDDDAELAAMLHDYLEMQGFGVETAGDAETGLQRIAASEPDLVILDVMLPGMSGIEALQTLRESRDLPVIMLTAHGEEADRILGLMHGADDYLAKPFNPLDLTARVKAVLKRSSPRVSNTEELACGSICLNLARRELTVQGRPVILTAAEMGVIEQLLRHPDEVLSRSKLTELALSRPLEAYDRSIDTLISKLRRKLAIAGIDRNCIRALRGHGYVLDSEFLGNV